MISPRRQPVSINRRAAAAEEGSSIPSCSISARYFADAFQFGGAQEPFALLFRVLRLGAVRQLLNRVWLDSMGRKKGFIVKSCG
jgi:hypothetical protein